MPGPNDADLPTLTYNISQETSTMAQEEKWLRETLFNQEQALQQSFRFKVTADHDPDPVEWARLKEKQLLADKDAEQAAKLASKIRASIAKRRLNIAKMRTIIDKARHEAPLTEYTLDEVKTALRHVRGYSTVGDLHVASIIRLRGNGATRVSELQPDCYASVIRSAFNYCRPD